MQPGQDRSPVGRDRKAAERDLCRRLMSSLISSAQLEARGLALARLLVCAEGTPAAEGSVPDLLTLGTDAESPIFRSTGRTVSAALSEIAAAL
jgi:hypothetical protein